MELSLRGENNQEDRPETKAVDYVISAMWVLKKEVLEKVGYLDENIFYAPEDVDYCRRLWLSGYSVVYDTRVSAIHHAQEISRGFKLNNATSSHIKGLIYYFWKHRYVFSPSIRADR